MGVNELWQILEPVKEHTDLHSLGGKTIAVDLSLWVCEALTVKKMIGAVMKPHLRNLFFRISFLTLMDVKLVFVMEGEPPKLKADVISKRNQIRYGTFGKTWSQTTGRSHFKSVLRECLGLLECLGIPWVQATGEAEAMCAYLNANGYVDGCLTNDGDAFLYGAQTVYRNFTMSTKDPHVDCYTVSSISNKLGLDREALVGLAVLLGCDYLPKGVPGVGKEQALKLIQTLRGQSLLQRFNQWNEESCYSDPQTQGVKKRAHCSVCCHPGSPKDHERNGCKLCKSDRYCEPHDYEYCCPCEWHRMERDRQLYAVENNIKKKACSCEGFPFHEVIQEFLLNKDKLLKVIRYQRPDLLLFQRFTFEKMEWPGHYACEKLLVLLTHYDMMERKLGRRNCNQLQPIRIVKTRIRNGVHCFEIEWEKPGHYTTKDTQHGELTVQTVEEQSLFEAAYPEIVALYQKHKLEIKKKKPKNLEIKPKGNDLPESDDVISLQSHISLKPTCETFPKQNSKTRLEISPSSKLPQESISQSPTTLLLPEDASCLDIEDELMSSPRPLTVHQKTVNKCLTSESSQPDTFSHNVSVIADLHLSSIDWESTSFGNSPAIQRNIVSHSLKSDLDMSCPSSISCIEEQSYDSEWYTTNVNKTSSRNLQKSNSVEHLLSDMTDLHLQDLPLKERICIKSLYPQGQVRPHDALKTLSLPKAKEFCISNSNSACPSHLSKNLLPTVHLQNESRNCEVLKGDQALRENYKTNTPLNHGSKIDVQTTQKIVMKKSVCLDRHSSDEESATVFGKAKYTTQKMKQYSQKRNPTQFKKSDSNKLSSHKIHTKETQECVQAYKLAGNVENCSTGPALSSLHFLQCREEKEDPTTCLDSPLPLCQRLKLRFQST